MRRSMQHTHEIRKRFLEYFRHQGHTIVASSPVFPQDDPTLLFTNAGMNQFKDVFLGKSAREYTSAATVQKCIRVGGKHNDLENVGHTSRHLTFFEMLGNFSFGEYFKKRAIDLAWHVTVAILQLDQERVWASVFREDNESFELWKAFLPEKRIIRLDEKDNFWAMGETGPCGPCSELLYDRGPHFGNAGNPREDLAGERYLEFWNLVFMQYSKKQDGATEVLPKPSIDTGAGLERVMSLIQQKTSLFETDVLRSLIAQVENISGVVYDEHSTSAAAFRVIADHIRTLAFAIADGVQPSNVERGYVLRKVLRRAVRYGKTLGFEAPFLAKLLPRLIEVMGKDYKELIVAKELIASCLTQEEEAFFRTLRRGGHLLNQIISVSCERSRQISGSDAFKLKDTYGFPLEEVLLIAKDYDLHVDVHGFEALEKEAKEKSKAASKTTAQVVEEAIFDELLSKHGPCRFEREKAEVQGTLIGIISEGAFCESLQMGQKASVILDATTFYPEMGGQVGDTGELIFDSAIFSVTNCTSPFKGIIAHHGILTQGHIQKQEKALSRIDKARREKIANNHTATHLLHWALHEVLGSHVKQAGSVVEQDRLRFDFTHHKALSNEEIRAIELLVNEKIRHNAHVNTYELTLEEAQKRHDIKQFFGEKYGQLVRVVDMGFSKELCGGTHTHDTGTIGYFRIAKESSIASGVRRIEAVTGHEAEKMAYQAQEELYTLAELLKVAPAKVVERIEKQAQELQRLELELKKLQKEKMSQLASSLLMKTAPSGICYLVHQVDVPPADLRPLLDILPMQSGLAALAAIDKEKVHILVKAFPDAVKKGIYADSILNLALKAVDGNGGGKKEFAQGAGKIPQNCKKALDQIIQFIEHHE